MKKIFVLGAAMMLAVAAQAETIDAKTGATEPTKTEKAQYDETKAKAKKAGKAIVEAGKATGEAVAEGTRATGKAIKERYPEVVDSVTTKISVVADTISVKAKRLQQKLKESK